MTAYDVKLRWINALSEELWDINNALGFVFKKFFISPRVSEAIWYLVSCIEDMKSINCL